MKADRAATIETGGNRLMQKSSRADPPLPLRIAEKPGRDCVQNLVDLASELLREAETLANDKHFADRSDRLTLNVSEGGIDFYAELEQFEIFMIRLALKQTGGHQAQAARLMHINPTTLNSKIKLYGIEY